MPELLSPAGSVEALQAALSEGADAVYLGVKDFNARLRSSNFSYAEVLASLKAARKLNRKIYLAVNTVFTERERDRVYQLLKWISEIEADAIIVQDFGVLAMAGNYFPALKIHASTQMNVSSVRACNFLSKHGASRVVLPRELSFEEIKKIRSATNIELEVFVHGSLCVSVSGLCLFSSFLGGKSANRGMCTQACRRLYSSGGEEGYYFSIKDLCLLEKIPLLVEAGINAFKIEGRMKSAEYAGAVTRAYRIVLDAVLENGGAENPARIDEALGKAKRILENDFAREKTFFHFEEGISPENYFSPQQDGGTGIKLGEILKVREGQPRLALIYCGDFDAEVSSNAEKILPCRGDSIRLHKKNDSVRATHKITYAESEKEGFFIDIPEGFNEGDRVYLIEIKASSHRYPRLLPKNLSAYKKVPLFDKAPFIKIDVPKHNVFAEGIYAAIEHIEDMYIVQSTHPAAVILKLNAKNTAAVCAKKNALPFSGASLIMRLDPASSEKDAENISAQIESLIKVNCKNYIAENLSALALLSQFKDINIIAGEYLYAFNRYAASFLFSQKIKALVCPLENSRKNLEETFSKSERGAVFITVYAAPALFRIRDNLKVMYPKSDFTGGRGEEFTLYDRGTNGGSLLLPGTVFSITDKIPFLRAAGFKRFIVDFSPFTLNKKRCKTIFGAAAASSLLPGASRFNWKNGFWTAGAGDK